MEGLQPVEEHGQEQGQEQGPQHGQEEQEQGQQHGQQHGQQQGQQHGQEEQEQGQQHGQQHGQQQGQQHGQEEQEQGQQHGQQHGQQQGQQHGQEEQEQGQQHGQQQGQQHGQEEQEQGQQHGQQHGQQQGQQHGQEEQEQGQQHGQQHGQQQGQQHGQEEQEQGQQHGQELGQQHGQQHGQQPAEAAPPALLSPVVAETVSRHLAKGHLVLVLEAAAAVPLFLPAIKEGARRVHKAAIAFRSSKQLRTRLSQSVVYLDAVPLSIKTLRSVVMTRVAGMAVFVVRGHRYEAELRDQASVVVEAAVAAGPDGAPTRVPTTYPLDEAMVLAVVMAIQPARLTDVIRLSGEALSVAAPGYQASSPTATLSRLLKSGFVGRRRHRVHCLHVYGVPDQLRGLDEHLCLKDYILSAVRLMVRPEDEAWLSRVVSSWAPGRAVSVVCGHRYEAELRESARVVVEAAVAAGPDDATSRVPTTDPLDEAMAPAVDPLDEAMVMAPAVDPLDEAMAPAVDPLDEAMAPAVDPLDEAMAPAVGPLDEAMAPAVTMAIQSAHPTDVPRRAQQELRPAAVEQVAMPPDQRQEEKAATLARVRQQGEWGRPAEELPDNFFALDVIEAHQRNAASFPEALACSFVKKEEPVGEDSEASPLDPSQLKNLPDTSVKEDQDCHPVTQMDVEENFVTKDEKLESGSSFFSEPAVRIQDAIQPKPPVLVSPPTVAQTPFFSFDAVLKTLEPNLHVLTCLETTRLFDQLAKDMQESLSNSSNPLHSLLLNFLCALRDKSKAIAKQKSATFSSKPLPSEVALPAHFFERDGDNKIQFFPKQKMWFSPTFINLLKVKCGKDKGWKNLSSIMLRELYRDNLCWMTTMGQRGTNGYGIAAPVRDGLFEYAQINDPNVSKTEFNHHLNSLVSNAKTTLKRRAKSIEEKETKRYLMSRKENTAPDSPNSMETEHQNQSRTEITGLSSLSEPLEELQQTDGQFDEGQLIHEAGQAYPFLASQSSQAWPPKSSTAAPNEQVNWGCST